MYSKSNKNILFWLLPALFVLLFFSIFRVIFNIYNADFVTSPASINEKFWVYFIGLGYDTFIIVLAQIPILVGFIFYVFFLNINVLYQFLRAYAFIVYSSLIVVSIADIPYFRFNSRRATAEVFDILGDSSSAFFSFLTQYWFFVVLTLAVLLALWMTIKYSFRKIEKQPIEKLPYIAIFLAILMIYSIHQAKTRSPKNASFYIKPEQRVLVTNTPISLLYSIAKRQKRLGRKTYFSDDELSELYSIQHQFESKNVFKKKNVFIFVLESFSYEYMVPGHYNKAPTPFLDQLMEKSIVFSNAYANGTTSSYGLMNILGGIPPFLNESYFASIYGDNQIDGIGSVLKDYGYTSSFFYGAEDDHYGFRKNMALLGIDNYFSREDYTGNEYDGNWGIYDEPFFQFAAEKIKQQSKPVFSTLFNISTHGPYMVPKYLRKTLPKGSLSSHQSTAYADLAIQKFFENIESEDWYNNSIFVFIADHWAKRNDLEFKNEVGRYRIPYFIYDPSKEDKIEVTSITQQLNVLPTVLEYLDYDGDWMSFGNSVLTDDNQYRFTFNEYENIYQLIDSSFVLKYDEIADNSFALFNYKVDPELESNLIKNYPEQASKMEKYLKAVIQTYNNSLIDNDLILEHLNEN